MGLPPPCTTSATAGLLCSSPTSGRWEESKPASRGVRDDRRQTGGNHAHVGSCPCACPVADGGVLFAPPLAAVQRPRRGSRSRMAAGHRRSRRVSVLDRETGGARRGVRSTQQSRRAAPSVLTGAQRRSTTRGLPRFRSNPLRAPLPTTRVGRHPPAGRRITGSLSAGPGCLGITGPRLSQGIVAILPKVTDRVSPPHRTRSGAPSNGVAPG